MNECDLFEDIQAFLDENREVSEEEYEKLLEAFTRVTSYVERFKQEKEEKTHEI